MRAVSPAAPLTWVVGRGGLLGQSLEMVMGETAVSESSRTPIWHPPEPITWSSSSAGAVELRHQAAQFLSAAGDRPWTVAWCAGAGVMGTSAQALRLELEALRVTLDTLAAAPRASEGAFFFSSSAGGVYAGVSAPPYDESSPVRPLADYGRAKLDGEAIVTAWSRRTGTPTLIGRIANLYGPGQNLGKAQGLISQICRTHLTGQPLSIYVSLDTLRDYLYAPDCARLIVAGLARLRQDQTATRLSVVTKVLASQRAITIGAVLGEMGRIFKRSPRIVLGASAVAAVQPKDLSLRSKVWPELDRRSLTPFPVGVANTAADLLRRLQTGALG
ncbi:MAG: NAD-dependent epimerase/dehydratase family protein [Dermatophilaceae bacterium]|nr:NAD-dependent epimerase/dehydratase family protein [Dermatophilaceae bacterium]